MAPFLCLTLTAYLPIAPSQNAYCFRHVLEEGGAL